MTKLRSDKDTPLWRRYLRFWGPAPGADIDDEFAFHVQATTEELVRTGWNLDEARCEAERRFGPVKHRRLECLGISNELLRRNERRMYLAGLWRDIRYAARVLWKTKISSACAVAILAITTGAAVAVFAVLDATVFKPLPFANANRLVAFHVTSERGVLVDPPYPSLERLRDLSPSLEDVAGVTRLSALAILPGEIVGATYAAHAACATGNYFNVLGARTQIGRTLHPSDDKPSANYHVAVATYRFWKDRYGLDPRALGATVYVASVPFTIVGVLPQGYEDIRKGANIDLYVPMAAKAEVFEEMFTNGPVQAIGLRAAGSRQDVAAAELTQLWDRLKRDEELPARLDNARLTTSDASHGIAAIDDEQKTSLYWAAWAVGLVLLIGCLNAACLLSAQTAARRNEISVRRALGASTGSILQQSLAESCLLAVTGGLLGILAATWVEGLILASLQWGNKPIDLTPDARVLGFSLALTLVTGILSGVFPAVHALRTRKLDIRRDDRLQPFASGKVLIATEVALSLVLVASASVSLHGISNLGSVPVGFNTRDVAMIRLYPNYEKFPDGVDRERYLTAEASRLRERLAQLPGMEKAAFATGRVFRNATTRYVVSRVGVTGESANVAAVHIDDKYFDVLEIPLVAGRAFSAADAGSGERVVVLSHSVAKRLFENQNPIGQRVSIGAITASVVGVAGDVRNRSLKEPAPSIVYIPFSHAPAGRGWAAETGIHVKTRQSTRSVGMRIDEEIKSGGYALRTVDASTLEETIGASYAADSIRMQITVALATIALFLVVAGLYGMMTYAVARRVREIGVRMAIGATPNRIVWLVVKECMTPLAIGVAIGLPGALAVMRVVSAYAFEVSAADPVSIAASVAAIVVTAVVAALRPARHATQVDPITALRAQ
jgi:predicted permease